MLWKLPTIPVLWPARDEPTTTDIIESSSISLEINESPAADEKHLKQQDISVAAQDVSAFEKSHQWDPNLPQEKFDSLHQATKTGDIEAINEVETSFVDDSPYEEVRAAVRNTDGGEIANTVRAWVLGMIFVTIGSGLNMFLSMRFVHS